MKRGHNENHVLIVELADAVAGLQVDMADKDRRIAALERRLSYLEDNRRHTGWSPSLKQKLKSEIDEGV